MSEPDPAPLTETDLRLILASASPRRSELLAHLGVDFEVVVSGFDESSISTGRPETLARRLAQAKALEVSRIAQNAHVVAADTVVVRRGMMLGKPADASEARAMLSGLRGRVHRVITAVVVVSPRRPRARVAHAVSSVRMRAYTDAEIESFIATGRPFDKSGGYAIQDADFAPVAAHEGCICSVIGLPLWTVRQLLQRVAGIETSEPAYERCMECPLRAADEAGERPQP